MTETTALQAPPRIGLERDDAPGWRPIAIDPVPARLVPLFVFLHIPKTAGSSLRLVFKRMFSPLIMMFEGAEQVRPTEANRRKWANAAFYNSYLMIGGHVQRNHPAVDLDHLSRRVIYVSVFRDPVARAVSGYEFSRRFRGHPMREFLSDKTLYQAVTTAGPFQQRYVMDQLRYAFGTTDPREAADRLLAGNYVVGPMQRLDGVIDAVSALSGLPRPRYLPQINTAKDLFDETLAPAREQPDYADALTALAELNGVEMAFLDEHVRDLVVTARRRPFA